MKTTVDPERVLAKLVALRTLNTGGYAHSGSGFLRAARFSGIRYGPEPEATCHPAAVTLNALAWALETEREFVPMCADGKALDKAFYAEWMGIKGAGPHAAVIRRDIGRAVELEELRRGDLLSIWWKGQRPGEPIAHVAYVFDAAFDQQGKTQAVQLFSAHGVGKEGPGISVFMPGAAMQEQVSGEKGSYALTRADLYEDRAFFETRAAWFSWREPEELELIDSTFRVESGRRVEPKALITRLHPQRSLGVRFHHEPAPKSIAPDTSGLTYHHKTQALVVDKADAVEARRTAQGRDDLLVEMGVPETRPQRHPDAEGKPLDQVPASQKADVVPLRWHRQVQRQLGQLFAGKKIKTDPGPADGCLAARTRAALREVQQKAKLEADGQPSPKTRERIAQMLQKMQAEAQERADEQAAAAKHAPRFVSGRWESGQALTSSVGVRALATTVGMAHGAPVFAQILPDGSDDVVLQLEEKVSSGKVRFSTLAQRLVPHGKRFRLRFKAAGVPDFEPEHRLELLPVPDKGLPPQAERLVQAALELYAQKPARFLAKTPVPWGDDPKADGPAPKAMAFVAEVYSKVLGPERILGVLGMKTTLRGTECFVPFPASHMFYKDVLDIEVNGRFSGDRRRVKAAFRRLKSRWKDIGRKLQHQRIDEDTDLGQTIPGSILVWPVRGPQSNGHAGVVVGSGSDGAGLRVVSAHPEQGLLTHSLAPAALVGMVLLTWR